MSKRARIIASIAVGLACWLYFSISSCLYLSSDNFDVALVTNGLFGSNTFCQYLHPLLCLIIKWLCPLIPTADMFTVVKSLFVFGELVLVFYMITAPLDDAATVTLDHTATAPLDNGSNTGGRKPPDKEKPQHDIMGSGPKFRWQLHHYVILALALLTVIFLSMGINLWRANYTISAGSFSAVGFALILIGKQYNHPRWIIPGVVYIAMGFMLRKECGLLVLPFAALHIGVDWLTASDRQEEMRNFAHHVLPAVLAVALLLVTQSIFYSIEPYRTALRYSDNRTVCVDFPMKGWSQIEWSQIEWSETDHPDQTTYRAATDWIFFDTKNIDADIFEAVAKAGNRNEYELTQRGVRNALMEMRRVAFRTDVYMAAIVVLVLLLALWNVIMAGGIWRRLEALLAIIGAFIILFYFTIRGRAPLRVWQPVMFATVLVEVMIFIGGWKGNKSGKTGKANETGTVSTATIVFMLVMGGLLYYSAGQVIAHASLHPPVTALTSRSGADDSEYHFDSLYIWPNWHATIPENFGDQNKLPPKEVLEHNIAAGDWTYGQPFYNEFLERIGASNPAVELAEGRAYVMEGNKELIEEYLREHFGDDISLVGTGIVIDEREAYRVDRKTDADGVAGVDGVSESAREGEGDK